VKFGITVTVSNGVDPTIIVKGGKCRMLKRMFELTKGSPEPIVDTRPLLVEWVERNGNRLINPSKAFVGLR